MGEVYRARDSLLKRDVAIKVLPEAFSRDADRGARFQREAEVLASLNHPNIAHIYGLEEADGSRCLVLEFVDGETLQERIQRGPIPVDEAMEIARQIAEALEAAHERGIVHRDLKPANVKVSSSGQVKVLDFGLAKAMDLPEASDFSQSPTLLSGGTQQGVILGTTSYMSPEQAKGKPADARSDIWAFGVVLYEMLTGRSMFTGDSVVEILGGVLKSEPDWTLLPAATPPALRDLLRRCLQKDRKRRLHSAADVRIEIEEALNEPATLPAAAPPLQKSRERGFWGLWAGTLLAVILAAAGMVFFRSPAVDLPETRLQIVTPPTDNPTAFAISPDGRKVVYRATIDGKTQLWLRRLDEETSTPIAGTENGNQPFWSPDSESIGFAADQKLKQIGIAGGLAQTLAALAGSASGGAGAWSRTGAILFARNFSGFYRAAPSGGTAEEVTRLTPQQASHRLPHFLPDGDHFLFYATGTPDVRGVYLGSLISKDARRLLDADTTAVFAPPDYILFGRAESLYSQRLDMNTLQPVGEAVVLADLVARNVNNQGSLAVSASAAGPIAYRAGATAKRQLAWWDISGKQTTLVGNPDTANPTEPSLSPDGRTIAISRTIGGKSDIWLMDAMRGTMRPFTMDPARAANPIWSPDSESITFISYRKGRYDLYQKAVDGSQQETLLLETLENKDPRDWSHDGRFILFTAINPETDVDLWALPLGGDRKPFAVAQTPFVEAWAKFSPDSQWIAYQSNETGRDEIHVRPFPGPGRSVQVSIGGGSRPQWRDGRILYQGPDNRVMSVSVRLQAPASIDPGTPEALFSLRPTATFVVARDGRLLVNTPLVDVPTPPITVLLNWAGAK
jgi:serine/threonine protein kinase